MQRWSTLADGNKKKGHYLATVASERARETEEHLEHRSRKLRGEREIKRKRLKTREREIGRRRAKREQRRKKKDRDG